MQKQLEAKHRLFANVDEMLSPQVLSQLLQTAVSTVGRSPFAEHGGSNNNLFEWVTTVADDQQQSFVLKRIRFENDWLMTVSNDILCRSVTLWQYGLLDELSSHLDHTIVACSHDNDGWAILMKDVSAGKHPVMSFFVTPYQLDRFLDALAFMHATFWQDDTLAGSDLGLNDNAGLISMTLVSTARKFSDHACWLATGIPEGWEIIQTLLERDALEAYRELMHNPQPLFDAVAHYPKTLTHGDYRSGDNPNLSCMPQQRVPVCAFDWQFAAYALMTIDLAWFINRSSVRTVINPHEAACQYRNQLEHHLGFHFDSVQWQSMLELGLLTDALRMGCIEAFFAVHAPDEETRRLCRAVVDGYNDQIRAGLRWL